MALTLKLSFLFSARSIYQYLLLLVMNHLLNDFSYTVMTRYLRISVILEDTDQQESLRVMRYPCSILCPTLSPPPLVVAFLLSGWYSLRCFNDLNLCSFIIELVYFESRDELTLRARLSRSEVSMQYTRLSKYRRIVAYCSVDASDSSWELE